MFANAFRVTICSGLALASCTRTAPPAGFPAVMAGSQNSCGTPAPNHLDTCVWQSSAELVVVGRIEAMRLVRDPCVFSDARGLQHDTAPVATTVVHRALEIELSVDDQILGDAPPTLRFRISPTQINSWDPAPLYQTAGRGLDEVAVAWGPTLDERAGATRDLPQGPLAEGMRLGVSLISTGDGWYTPVLPFFDIGSDGMVFREDACMLTYPAEARGLSPVQLKELLEGCGARDPAANFFPIERDSASSRAVYDAAQCSIEDTTECSNNRDCEDGSPCVAGRCTQR